MKKWIIFSIILLVIMGLSFNSKILPNLSRSFHHTFTKSIDLSDENIEGLRLYDSIDDEEIVLRYGKQTKQSRNVTGYNYFELRKGIEVAANTKGEILRFIVTDEKIETTKGISLGDNDIDVKDAYGNNHYSRREQGAEIIGYIDKENNTSIEFWISDDKVIMIRLDDTSMK